MNLRPWPPTRAAVIYVIAMLSLYLVTEALGVFGDAALPVQDVLGVAFVVAVLPAGLVVLPLYFVVFVLTGGYLGDGLPYMTEVLMAVAVLLNAVFVNWVARRRQRRKRQKRAGDFVDAPSPKAG